MDGWLSAFVVASAPRERRGRIAEAMLPGLLPVPAAQRAAVAAVAADQQVRNADQRQEQAVGEMISAVQTVATRPDASRALTDRDLTALPTLRSLLSREGVGADLRSRIDSLGAMLQADTDSLVDDAITLIAMAIDQTKGVKLSEADLKKSRLGGLIVSKKPQRDQVMTPTPAPS